MRVERLVGVSVLRRLSRELGPRGPRLGIAAIAAIVGLLVLRAVGPEGDAPAQSLPARPNIVVVMTDDQTVEQMQALRRVRSMIGRAGTMFTQHFSTFPLCCPSRATYLTGQYAHNHGVRSNLPPGGGFPKLDSSNTLPVWLRKAGYATAHVGKYLNGYGDADPYQVPAGWQEWHGSVHPVSHFFDYCINENGRLVAYGWPPASACPGALRRPRIYKSDLYTRKAVGYINRRAPSTQPFFLSVAHLAPHNGGPNPRQARCSTSAKPAPRHRGAYADAPLPQPPGFDEDDVSDKPAAIRSLSRLDSHEVAQVREEYQCRRESLLAVDEGVGAMVEALHSKGELSNTLFVFTSDNGYFHGEHRVERGKNMVYEPSVRVPVLMRGPGVPRDKRVAELSGNIDLAATIVDAADADPGRVLDGVSLLELARRPALASRRAIMLENGPAEGGTGRNYDAIRKDGFKYVEYRNGERELYDLVSDPFEERSLHGSPGHAILQGELAEELQRLRDCSGSSCRR